MEKKLRIAAFGFRTLPPSKGAAGADKFAMELLPRLAAKGHEVIAYNRRYADVNIKISEYKGVRIKTFGTVKKKGFDTLLHSFKCTMHIIFRNSAKIVHIQNGGNSIWALPLRLFGKKVFISQDGIDWKRDKWPWYAKMYLKLSSYISAYCPNEVIFDNVIAQQYFEKRFKKKFSFIPFGSEVAPVAPSDEVFKQFGLQKGGYYLFVGRFIPDKGLHYLLPAFANAATNRKLVLVGGSPNPSDYEKELHAMAGPDIIFTGFVYGDDVTRLMLNSYCYIQPSDVEGLSPVILSVMGLGVPLIVSDIDENIYAVKDTAVTFIKANKESLKEKIDFAENNYEEMQKLSVAARERALKEFNWDYNARDACMQPVMAAAARWNIPVLQHTWSMTNIKQRHMHSDPEDTAQLARRHPNVQVIMAHLTGCGYRGVLEAKGVDNLVVDTSGGFPESGILDYALEHLGADHIVYGSDLPIRETGVTLQRTLAGKMSPAERDKVLYGNARRVLKL